jgi:rhamnulokinase
VFLSDAVTAHFLAFDLGAESGRAMVGSLDGGVLALREVHRFANDPIRRNDSLRWDIVRLWEEIRRGLDLASENRLQSVGVDCWGVDYALLDAAGELLEQPYHYRDRRTEGVMESVFERVPRERIYAATGIQFLSINTIYQLAAACRRTPEVVDAAQSLATIPDVLNYWLSGKLVSEYTIATTTQMVDARTRTWAIDLLNEIGLPGRLLQPIVEAGSVTGVLQPSVSTTAAGTPIVAPACHDTGSAVASVNASAPVAFLSSGTWSLLGTEVREPVINSRALALNFTNEGGVCGTTRLLKNIAGLWLLQSCRRLWQSSGQDLSYETLIAAAADDRRAFRALVDPDDPRFVNPGDMPAAISEYCRQTAQSQPDTPASFTRVILESLAFKYRAVLESLEELTGRRFEEIRIIGGGARNRLLSQWTADATGRTVTAGPVEATALGNVAVQMIATGAVASLAEARAVIDRSFPVERFEPLDADRWDAEYRRFQHYMEFTCA